MLLGDTKLGSSGHRGLGLFAKQRIAKGTKIWTFHPGFDQEFEPAAVDALPGPARMLVYRYCYINADTGKIVLCADDARFMNHADEPNTTSLVEGDEEGSTVAIRDIEAGEEITVDYYEYDADAERKLQTPP